VNRLIVSAAARRDIANALHHSHGRWGPDQRRRYQALIVRALDDLRHEPMHPASRARDEIRSGVRTLHIARSGQAGRHLQVYRLDADGNVELIRLLHDAMDLRRGLAGR